MHCVIHRLSVYWVCEKKKKAKEKDYLRLGFLRLKQGMQPNFIFSSHELFNQI